MGLSEGRHREELERERGADPEQQRAARPRERREGRLKALRLNMLALEGFRGLIFQPTYLPSARSLIFISTKFMAFSQLSGALLQLQRINSN